MRGDMLTSHRNSYRPPFLDARAIALLVAAIGLLAVSTSYCAPISGDQAAAAVRGWLAANPAPLRTQLGSQVSDVEAFSDCQGATYYVVYLWPKGFVIAAADDLVEPIVGFAGEGVFDPFPTNPLGALVGSDIPARVREARDHEAALREGGPALADGFFQARRKWQRFSRGVSALGGISKDSSPPSPILTVSNVWVSPLTQTNWNQQTDNCGNACYNYYTPQLSGSTVVWNAGDANNYPCGCVVTAMAQLMRHFQFPVNSILPNSGTVYVGETTKGVYTNEQTRSLLGGSGPGGAYNWSNMPFNLDSSDSSAQRQEVGKLCYDAAVSLSMDFDSASAGGSGAYMYDGGIYTVPNALINFFGYSNAIDGENGVVNNIGAGLIGMINPNLDAGLPVLLAIFENGSNAGHAILADGYGYDTGTLYHHLNLGWGGYCTAWYNLPTISAGGDNFNIVTDCVYNVYTTSAGGTTSAGEIISGQVTDTAGNPIAGASVSASRNTTTYGPCLTDSAGIYAIPKLPSNKTYTVTCSAYTAAQTVLVGSSGNGNSTSGNVWGVNFPSPSVTSFTINNGAATTSSLTVTLNNSCIGSPASYAASESFEFLALLASLLQRAVIYSLFERGPPHRLS